MEIQETIDFSKFKGYEHLLYKLSDKSNILIDKSNTDSCILTSDALARCITPNIDYCSWAEKDNPDDADEIVLIFFGYVGTTKDNFDYDHIALVYKNTIYDSFYRRRYLSKRDLEVKIDYDRLSRGLDYHLYVPEYEDINFSNPKRTCIFMIPPIEIDVKTVNSTIERFVARLKQDVY